MVNNKINKRRLSARLSLEIIMMVSIAAVVVIAVLSMFIGNLSKMTSASGFRNMLKQEDRTKIVVQNKDYAASQINAQTVASQGVIEFKTVEEAQNWAANIIKTKLSKSKEDLNKEDLEQLMKAALIKKQDNQYDTNEYKTLIDGLEGLGINYIPRQDKFYLVLNGKKLTLSYSDIHGNEEIEIMAKNFSEIANAKLVEE